MNKYIRIGVVVVIAVVPYIFWLLQDNTKLGTYIFCVDGDGQGQIVSINDKSRCSSIKNINPCHFTFSQEDKAFKDRFWPWAKIEPMETRKFDLHIDTSSTFFSKSFLDDHLPDYEEKVNLILEYLYLGFRIDFENIHYLPGHDTLVLDDFIKSKEYDYLIDKRVLAKEPQNSNHLIVTERKYYPEKKSNNAYTFNDNSNIHTIFSQEAILLNPFLFLHEFLHFSSGKYAEHDDEISKKCVKDSRSKSILSHGNSPCRIFLRANDLLKVTTGDSIGSHNMVTFPPEMDSVCCEKQYRHTDYTTLYILLIHLHELFLALDHDGKYAFLETVLKLWVEDFIDTSAFDKNIQKECDKVGLPYTAQYSSQRLDAHRIFLDDNARQGLNYLLKNRFPHHQLDSLPLEIMLQRYYQENKTDERVRNIFNPYMAQSINISTGVDDEGKEQEIGKADAKWKRVLNDGDKDAYVVEQFQENWNAIDGAGIIFASPSTKSNLRSMLFEMLFKVEHSTNLKIDVSMRADDRGELIVLKDDQPLKFYEVEHGFNKNTEILDVFAVKKGEYKLVFDLTDMGVVGGFSIKGKIDLGYNFNVEPSSRNQMQMNSGQF